MWKSWLKQLANRPAHRPLRRSQPTLEALEDRSVPSATFTFAQGLGANQTDEGLAVATDASGSFYVTGSFSDTLQLDGSTSLSSAGSTDIFVAKYNSAGVLEWGKRFGGELDDAGEDIAVDSLGNVYVTGYFSGTAAAFESGNLSSFGGKDIFVTKLDTDGAGVWDLAMGGSDNDAGNALAVGGSGDVYVTGSFRGTATMGSGSLTGGAGPDVFVSKLSASDGSGVWDRRLGGDGEEVGLGIGVDSQGNVYTTGYFQGTADFNPLAAVSNLISVGGYDGFLSKLDSGGNFQWAQRFGSTGDDRGVDLAVDGSGNVYTTGDYHGTVAFGAINLISSGTSLGATDIFVSKVSSSGNNLWAVSLGGPEVDSGGGIAVDGAGDVYVTGAFQDTATFGTDSFTSAGTNDAFITKLSTSGVYRWSRQMGGNGVDVGHGVAVSSSGLHLYVTGSFSDTASFGSTTLTTPGDLDIFIAKLSQDVTPPVTTAILAGDEGTNGWYTGDVEVTLDATDANSGVASTHYRIDGGDWVEYTTSFTISGDGSYLVEFYSVDEAGNQEATQSVTVTIDTVAPTTTLLLTGTQGTNGWYASGVQVSFSAADNESGVFQTQYSLDGGPLQVYTGPFTISTDGTHTIDFYSTDNAGLVETPKSATFKLDATAPSTGHTLSGTQGANGWYTTGVTIGLSGSDVPSGLAQTQYRIDGGAWQTYSSPFTVSSNGHHTVEYYSIDNAGKQEGAHSISFKVDASNPTTSHTLSGTQGANGWYTSAVTVSLNASDAGAGVSQTRYRINGGAWQTYSGAFGIGANGSYTIEYYSIDNAGREEPVKSFSFTIETRFVIDGNTLYVLGTPGNDVFTFNVDASSLLVSVNGGSMQVSRFDIQNVVFDGKTGLDTATFVGWAAGETLWVGQAAAAMTDGQYHMYATAIEIQYVGGGGGVDVAYVFDSTGHDFFYSAPGVSYLTDWITYSNGIYGFTAVTAFAGNGGTDQAYLYDSAGNDFFLAGVALAQMGNGFSYVNTAYGFEVAQGVATAGGFDQGFFFDSSASDDVFYADRGAFLITESGYQNSAAWLDAAFLFAWNGVGWSFVGGVDATVTGAVVL